MLNENLKRLRKSKGLTQLELAEKVNVVRQTVSKWETGLSVPDSEQLMELADLFDVPVAELLGETPVNTEDTDDIRSISEKLAAINEYLVRKEERKRKILHGVSMAALIITALYVVMQIFIMISLHLSSSDYYGGIGVIGGADGPTAVYVTNGVSHVSLVFIIAVLCISVCGVCLTRKK